MHGHVTVDGQKISKRRGNFITAGDFAKQLDPDYLRYYYAAKLGSTTDDLDLNLADFVAKVNSDLVGKLVNIASRCAGFVHKLERRPSRRRLPEPALYAEFAAAADDLAARLRAARVRARRAQDHGARRSRESVHRRAQAVDPRQAGRRGRPRSSPSARSGLNLFRALIVYLKPIVPALAARAEALLAAGELRWHDVAAAAARHAHRQVRGAADARRARRPSKHLGEAGSERHARPTATNQRQWRAARAATIDLAEFQKTELRVARVIEASYVDGADKLLQAQARRRRRGTHGVLGHPQLLRAGGVDESARHPRRELGAAQDALRRIARHGARRERRRPRHLPLEPRFGREARHEGELAMGELLLIALGAALVNNFVLVQFLGVCPFMGGSRRVEGAIGMGLAIGLVLTTAAGLTQLVDRYLLRPFELEYLRLIALIVVIGVAVKVTEA